MLDPSVVVQIVILIILLILSAFFSSAETAVTTCNRIRIRTLEEEGNKRAKKLGKILDNMSKALSTILIGNNVVNLTASSMSTILATKMFGSQGIGIATGILTLLILIFGEISPKTLATIHSEKLALHYSGIIYGLMVIFTPIIFVVEKLSRGFLRLIGVNPDAKSAAITETELRTIVDVSHEEGVIEKSERNMIKNVVDFGDARAKDIMVPRIDMSCIEVTATYDELIEEFRKDMFTRLPVYEEDNDNVIGVINMKDVLLYHQGDPFSIRDYLRKVHYTYEYKHTAELMKELREANSNVAIVLDEYGTTAGMITLEDLLEEIVGEIRDEYDEDEKNSFKQVGEREYLIDGAMKLSDVSDHLEIEMDSDDYDTLGGFVIGLLDHLPVEGEQAEAGGYRFVVEKMDKKRVETVRMTLPELVTPEESE